MAAVKKYLPMPIRGKPYRHQLAAYQMACDLFGLMDGKLKSHGCAFLMEMGCGKTLSAIGVAGALFKEKKIKRILIVCPVSVTGVWQEEFEKFAAYPYALTILNGSSEKKILTLHNLPKAVLQVVVINYESTWRIEGELLHYNADLIIADEAHKIKEGRSKQSKAMHHLGDHAMYKLLLTGTAISGKEEDIWSEYRFLEPSIFGTSFYRFRSRYFYMSGYGNHIPVFRKSMLDDFEKRLHCIAYRVTKAQCLDLPVARDLIIPIDLEPKAAKKYLQLEVDAYTQLKKSAVSATNILTKMLRLSQCTGGHLTGDDGRTETVSTAKLNALEDIVDSTMEEGKKLVVMARFVAELDDIEAMLKKKGIGYVSIRGGVKDRMDLVDQFQNDPDCKVFVGQISAAGLGITLTAADTMVMYSLSYSMGDFDQMKARIHRSGQKNDCLYIYLMARANGQNTIDYKVLKSLQDKVSLAKQLVDDYRNGKNPYASK